MIADEPDFEEITLPQKLRSPANDALLPVNEKNGKGTGMGTLMPTWSKIDHEYHYQIKFSK